MPTSLETFTGLQQLLEDADGPVVVLHSHSTRRFASGLPLSAYRDVEDLPDDLARLVVIGGGTLIDQAKFWRLENAPGVELFAIPSIWGSGAEVSPIAVRNQGMHKEIRIDPRLAPDRALIAAELADTIPDDLCRKACGDTWSHALEGFLSPLADDALRDELAELVRDLLELPIGRDDRWFEASARACLGQSKSSVGLVHGIAHTLEGPLRRDFPDQGWGHARLCSVFLLPVMKFNRAASGKFDDLCRKHGLDGAAIIEILKQLHDAKAYNQAVPLLNEHWMDIVRDPCSRTNSCLVRPGSHSFFTEQFVR